MRTLLHIVLAKDSSFQLARLNRTHTGFDRYLMNLCWGSLGEMQLTPPQQCRCQERYLHLLSLEGLRLECWLPRVHVC